MIESLVLKGDLSGLSPHDKVEYYRLMCERVGLDPTTQPFKLLNLSGKQVMYCDRSGAQQLNKIHGVSHQKLEEKEVRDVFIVYMRASMKSEKGERFTDSSGAVNIAGLKGDALANAIMKAETKAKRRATLDLLGLGILDESEVETIPGARKVQIGEKFDESFPEDISQEKPAQVQSQGASFDQFDPRKEIMTFGKNHNGIEWINVPDSYLEWMSDAAKGDDQIKAKATLEFKKKVGAQLPDVFDGVFDKKPDELTPIEQLQASFDIAYRNNNVEVLETWAEIHKAEIDKLSETEKKGMRKLYADAIKKFGGKTK